MAIFNSQIFNAIENGIKSRFKNLEGKIEMMADKAPDKKAGNSVVIKNGDIINNRYRIEEFFKKMEGCNVYMATDTEAYRKCWGCGHGENEKEDVFCNHCGVELSTKIYQLIETGGANNFSTEALFIKTGAVHPNIMRLYDRFIINDKEYLLSEYVNGVSLGERQYDANQLKNIAAALTDMVDFLHSHNILASGIKADDFIASEGVVKLANLAGLKMIESGVSNSRKKKDIKRIGRLLIELAKNKDEDSKLLSVLQKAANGGFSTTKRLREWLEENLEIDSENEGILVGSLSDVGIIRRLNEDSFKIADISFNNSVKIKKAGLFVVADGMGGHQSGDVASSMAVDALIDELKGSVEKNGDIDNGAVAGLLKDAVTGANKRVYDFARINGKDMGTTIVASLIFADNFYTVNIGDSRAYLIRNGEAVQITKDHSLVARLVELNMVEAKDARNHPKGNVLLRTIGTDPKVESDLYQTKIRRGDYLLLCTDGLWNQLFDDEIAHVIKKNSAPQDACRELIRIANERGGPDNITAILIKINNTEKQ